MHLVAVHARHIKTVGVTGGVQRGVVTRALGAKAEVVAHQHVARLQAAQKHVVNKGLRALAGQGLVEAVEVEVGVADAREVALLEVVEEDPPGGGAGVDLKKLAKDVNKLFSKESGIQLEA